MNDLRSLLSDVAEEVAPADLAPRVTAGVRRRTRRRRAAVAAFSVVALGVAAIGSSALFGDRQRSGVTTTNGADGFDVVWLDLMNHGAQWSIKGQSAGVPRRDLGIVQGDITGYDLSPDGKRLAYTVPEGIAVVELTDGVPVSRFTVPGAPGGAMEAEPVWAPDSKRVLYRRISTRSRGSVVYDGFSIVDTTTGSVTDVEYPHTPGHVAWSPDGWMVALTPLTGGIDLVALSGERVNGLGLIGWQVASPHAWSPDGTRLLVTVTTDLGDGRTDQRTVVSTMTGDVVAELPTDRGVWRDEGHVAHVHRFTVEEYALDGTKRDLLELDLRGSGLRDPLVRPAS